MRCTEERRKKKGGGGGKKGERKRKRKGPDVSFEEGKRNSFWGVPLVESVEERKKKREKGSIAPVTRGIGKGLRNVDGAGRYFCLH